ncbi:hypothetical protein NC652_017566 [Populus alba x Populus x berolinensis]|nr:hypothetical protein NC652_017566 [Populus alba x Populus x berolinensis]
MTSDKVGYLRGGVRDKSRVNREVSNVEDNEVSIFNDIKINHDEASKNTKTPPLFVVAEKGAKSLGKQDEDYKEGQKRSIFNISLCSSQSCLPQLFQQVVFREVCQRTVGQRGVCF